jgi:hypothetical protein
MEESEFYLDDGMGLHKGMIHNEFGIPPTNTPEVMRNNTLPK